MSNPAAAMNEQAMPVEVMFSCFAAGSGGGEFNFMLLPTAAGTTETQLDWLDRVAAETLAKQDLDKGDIVFARYFCSELAGGSAALRQRAHAALGHCAISIVIQPPATPARVALWLYCIEGARQGSRGSATQYHLARGGVEHSWVTGLAQPGEKGPGGQTTAVFSAYREILAEQSMRLQDHCLRTWLYVKDVDNDYAGLVHARNEVFEGCGLTPDTHYIASTGIQGCNGDRTTLVSMDGYAVCGLLPGQIRHIRAPRQLCDTHLYGVRFERATAVSYRDRTQVFVSGTASIDAAGDVVHVGDVGRQLQRALENISALLEQSGATLEDMQHFIAYVRNADDATLVHDLLGQRVGNRPFLVVTAPVCRPEWLVEVEGIAITASDDDSLPDF